MQELWNMPVYMDVTMIKREPVIWKLLIRNKINKSEYIRESLETEQILMENNINLKRVIAVDLKIIDF